jgi:hypothetical protein
VARRIVIAIAVFVAGTSTVFADPIAIRASRTIGLDVVFTDELGRPGTADAGAFSLTSGIFRESRAVSAQTDLGGFLSMAASQNTNFDPIAHRVSGSGSISAGPNSLVGISEVDKSHARSDIDLTFTLARATPFRFSGVLAASGDAEMQATLDFDVNEFAGPVPVRFNHSGILQPGSHVFFTHAELGENIPSITGAASFDIDFSLGSAATPEPASVALLVTGIAAAGLSHRRTRRRPERC